MESLGAKAMTDMEILSLPPGSQVLKAAKRLVRLIHEEGLSAGSEMPKQEELRKLLPFSNDTLSAALKILSESGVVERRRRSGTRVLDPEALVPNLWTVIMAVIPMRDNDSPFFYQLYMRSIMKLNSLGFKVMFSERGGRGNSPDPDFASCFPGLEQTLKSGMVDGLLTSACFDREALKLFKACSVPFSHMGSWELAPSGAAIDSGSAAREGLKELAKSGASRFAIVCNHPPRPGYDSFWKAALETLPEIGRSESDLLLLCEGDGFHSGAKAAERLASMPKSRRPDGLVVLDDVIACGLSSSLAQSSYRPRLAVQTNIGPLVPIMLPAFSMKVDVELLARTAVEELRRLMLNPSSKPRLALLPPSPPVLENPPVPALNEACAHSRVEIDSKA